MFVYTKFRVPKYILFKHTSDRQCMAVFFCFLFYSTKYQSEDIKKIANDKIM